MRRVAGVVLALFALVVSAWFAIGIRQAHDTAVASAITSGTGRLSAREAQRAIASLRAAGFLNPDSEIDALRARLASAQGDFRGARKILDRVVAREPKNASAWYALALAALDSPRTWARAFRSFLRLVPPVRAAG